MKHHRTAAYVEKICNNKSKIMKKIHKVSYSEIFSREFKTTKIDQRLDDLEIDEKLMIIDNVIDYLQENFRELAPPKKRSTSRRGSPDREN
jgi:hypothetical protein